LAWERVGEDWAGEEGVWVDLAWEPVWEDSAWEEWAGEEPAWKELQWKKPV